MRFPDRTSRGTMLGRAALLLALLSAAVAPAARGAAADAPAPAGRPAAGPASPPDLTAACDGERDAAPALQAAYDARAARGGGEVLIPPGRTCRLDGGVAVRPRVALRCAPGARLVVTAAKGWAFSGSELRETSIDGCTVVLAGGAGALDLSGVDLEVKGVRILAESERSADGSLARLDCRDGSCRFGDGSLRCAHPTGRGIEVSATGAARGWIRDNDVRGCREGIRALGGVSIAGNVVDVEGQASAGVSRAGKSAGADLSGNEVRAKGDGAVGIAVEGGEITVRGNRVVVAGDGAVAFRVAGNGVQLVGNFHAIRGTRAIGYRVSGSAVTIGSCTGRGGSGRPASSRSEADGRIHVSPVGANQVTVDGCNFLGGAYGVAATGPTESTNVTVSANRMTLLSQACVVATTGFVVTGNYCAWLTSNAHAVLLGDERLPRAAIIHGVISNNLFQCLTCSALVAGPSILGRCRSDPERPCRQRSDCANERHPRGDACEPGRVQSLVVSGNSFLGAHDGTGIDLGAARDADAASVSQVVIAGNQFTMRGQCTAIGFPTDAAARERIRDVEIGVNSSNCPTYVAGFDEGMGRIAGEEDRAEARGGR